MASRTKSERSGSSHAGTITTVEARAALMRSGYVLEQRVEAALTNMGLVVSANVPYADPDTGKSRELDLSADLVESFGPKNEDHVEARLAIECLNNPQPIALLGRSPGEWAAYASPSWYGIPTRIKMVGGSFLASIGFEGVMVAGMHQSLIRAGTQYCSFVRKKTDQEWMALHPDEYHEVLTAVCSAADQLALRDTSSFIPYMFDNIELGMVYPVVVLQGPLLDAVWDGKEMQLTESGVLGFRRLTASGKGETEHFIDFVQESALKAYVDLIRLDLSTVTRFFLANYDRAIESVRQIGKEIEAARTDDERARALR